MLTNFSPSPDARVKWYHVAAATTLNHTHNTPIFTITELRLFSEGLIEYLLLIIGGDDFMVLSYFFFSFTTSTVKNQLKNNLHPYYSTKYKPRTSTTH